MRSAPDGEADGGFAPGAGGGDAAGCVYGRATLRGHTVRRHARPRADGEPAPPCMAPP